MTGTVTICSPQSNESDVCDMRIVGEMPQDTLDRLDIQVKSAGFNPTYKGSEGTTSHVWILQRPRGELVNDDNLTLLHRAIESAGIEVAG
jgi:hypothetical protein